MHSTPLVDTYFDRWNEHDGRGLARLFGVAGTYEYPSTGAPISARDLPSYVDALVGAFPDLRFERVSSLGEGSRVVVEWVMRGTYEGDLFPGIEPTGETLKLCGIDVFEISSNEIQRVIGYFDQKSMVEQIGLMALIQPIQQGPAAFGYSMRVPSGNPKPPGVIALTWIRGRDATERDRIRGHSREIVADFLEEPGFIGIVTGFTGDRGFTVTAWEDEAALQRGLSQQHMVAMRELRSEDFVPGVWTSVWKPIRVNRIWTRCPSCTSLEDVSDDHRRCSRCNSELPERPPFW